LVALVINTFPNRKLVGYKYRYQLADIAPNLIISVIMGAVVYLMNGLNLSPLVLLVLQVAVGVVLYLGLSIVTRNKNLNYLLEVIKQFIRKEKV
jgi:peptidoglycan biosynthesis protein MviN/MurJ (putative lipid II flippase)